VQIANIYLLIGRQREAWVEMLRVLDKKLPVIVVGDFNIDSEEDEMKRMEEEVMGIGVV
jgi:endonuclease/exonuclease/phosphatase family metal-dependent hydrolase